MTLSAVAASVLLNTVLTPPLGAPASGTPIDKQINPNLMYFICRAAE